MTDGLVTIAGAIFTQVFPEEFLLDLYDEDLPPDDDLNNHPDLWCDGEMVDTYHFMQL